MNHALLGGRHQRQIMTGHQIAELSDGAQIGHLLTVNGKCQCDMRLISPNGRMEGSATSDDSANAFQYGEIIETEVDGCGQWSKSCWNRCGFLELNVKKFEYC